MHRHSLLLLAVLVGCGGGGARGGSASCGLAAVAGPTSLLTQFSVPNQTVVKAPAQLPGRLVARLAAGPAVPAIVGRTGTDIVVGVDGALPAGTALQFGVLVLAPGGVARGVMLFEVSPVQGAPVLGQVHAGTQVVPLLGIALEPSRYEDAACPFFPDSVLK